MHLHTWYTTVYLYNKQSGYRAGKRASGYTAALTASTHLTALAGAIPEIPPPNLSEFGWGYSHFQALMNFKTKVLSTFTRHFSNGSQDFSRVQIRFRQADFSYPIFHAIEFDMGDTSDGWPIHFKTSEALHERFKESDRQVHWWELEGEVPADSVAVIIEQATAIAKKYLLPTPQPVAA